MRAIDGRPADLYSVEAKSPLDGRAAEYLSLKVWNRTAVRGHMHNFVMG